MARCEARRGRQHRLASRFHQAAPQDWRERQVLARSANLAFGFLGGALDFSLSFDGNSTIEWIADDENGHTFQGVLDRKQRTLLLARVVTLRLAWPAGNDPVFIGVSWYDSERRTGILPSVYASDPGAPAGPASIDATVRLPASPSGIASAALDWPLNVGSDGATFEGEVIAYQIGRRFLGAPASSAAPATGPATSGDVLRPFAPLYLSQQSIADPPPRILHVDYNDGTGLGPGWWGWWVRGVDCSAASAPRAVGTSDGSRMSRRHRRRCSCRRSGFSAHCR